eukprot:CAMPEP_0197520734 /NCGR_PEP_ID=MMETSP1318-20131121/6064_1 /TAXON_ID=552666 /ORGANISM="Partenskyella glossopodia, Strain RCC365" /LENGTH=104 /DNA_ID=CAMNT_0043072437 /DNA_START=97 /DNA_END=408 /DNA_ORIENTATION=-
MESKFIPEAIKIVKSAVQADNENKLKEALALYKKALKYFIVGLKYEKGRSRELVREKIDDYMKRAEEIKAALADSKSNKKTVVHAGSGSTKVKKKKKTGGGEGG